MANQYWKEGKREYLYNPKTASTHEFGTKWRKPDIANVKAPEQKARVIRTAAGDEALRNMQADRKTPGKSRLLRSGNEEEKIEGKYKLASVKGRMLFTR